MISAAPQSPVAAAVEARRPVAAPTGGVSAAPAPPVTRAGTTGLVADRLQRNCIGIELNPEYARMARERIFNDAPLFAEAAE